MPKAELVKFEETPYLASLKEIKADSISIDFN